MMTIHKEFEIGSVVRFKTDLKSEEWLNENYIITGFAIRYKNSPIIYMCKGGRLHDIKFGRAYELIPYNGDVACIKPKKKKANQPTELIDPIYDIGETVYLITDEDRSPHVVTEILYKGFNVMLYELSQGNSAFYSSADEITSNKFTSVL